MPEDPRLSTPELILRALYLLGFDDQAAERVFCDDDFTPETLEAVKPFSVLAGLRDRRFYPTSEIILCGMLYPFAEPIEGAIKYLASKGLIDFAEIGPVSAGAWLNLQDRLMEIAFEPGPEKTRVVLTAQDIIRADSQLAIVSLPGELLMPVDSEIAEALKKDGEIEIEFSTPASIRLFVDDEEVGQWQYPPQVFLELTPDGVDAAESLSATPTHAYAESVAPPLPQDGPEEPNFIRIAGRAHELTPLQFRMVQAMWDCKTMPTDDFIEQVWGVSADIGPKSAGSAISKLNTRLHEIEATRSISLSTKNGYVVNDAKA